MKTILVFVTTLDGKVTKWDSSDVRGWSSESDKEYFLQIWNNANAIIIGRNTYDAEPIRPVPSHLLLVMTRHPEEFKQVEVKGQLEFTDESPDILLNRLAENGYETVLIAGGPHIATEFLHRQLADELWLTIEPRIFGQGLPLIVQKELDIKLHLLSLERVNEDGTLITRYAVIKKDK
jgi:dihydrofolate reductase